jgi:predicted glycosyltransferase
MKILIYVGHPAQYLFFRQSIKTLLSKGNSIILLIKTKDVLENIIKEDGFNYINIMPQPRGNSKVSIALSLIKRNFRILPIILREKPDLLVGGDPSISQLGWLLGKNRFTLTEDDYPIIKTQADLTFPFAQYILSPEVCDSGKWHYKKVGYNGYMKLAYLHPDQFSANKQILSKYNIEGKYVLIRLAQLTAHHDFGIKGLNNNELNQIIATIKANGYKVFISSEGELADSFIKYKLSINPADLHHILNFSSLLISDSQSMSVEASMLGAPSIRYSDFAGRISVLEELEHKYQLTYGILPGKINALLRKIDELLSINDLSEIFKKRRQEMLNDKINVSEFTTWFIENYPKSARIMKENPEYQYNFK